MKPDSGWFTAQMPIYVTNSPNQQATFVDPAVKDREAAGIRAEVEAFIRAGGNFERITTPRCKRQGRGG